MIKAIDVCRKMIKNPDESGYPLLKEINLHTTFDPIYEMEYSVTTINSIACFIIYAYDPDSGWLDLKKDRRDNKLRIINSLGVSSKQEIFEDILNGSNDTVNDVILHYLIELTDWRWQTIFTLLDYHANMIRFVNQKTDSEKSIQKMDKEGAVRSITEDYDVDTISKVNKQKGELLNQAIDSRKKADELLLEIKKDFVSTDAAVQSDFGFSYTDTAKKPRDIMSWREFIREKNERKAISS